MDDNPSILLHGALGLGIWDALYAAASATLCEQVSASGAVDPTGLIQTACGQCAACHLVSAGTHPDLMIVTPEALRAELELPFAEGADSTASGEKRGPGKDISIDAIRGLVEWAHGTSHRGGRKVAVVYPLDAMTAPAANALLKILEEPPASLYFLTGTHHLDRVLPTLRSRCRLRPIPRPTTEEALRTLQERGLTQAQDTADWCRNAVYGASPDGGLDWARQLLAALLHSGKSHQRAFIEGTSPAIPIAVIALQKLTMDMLRTQYGQPPLYLPSEEAALADLGARAGTSRLLDFSRRLAEYSSTSSFPLHAGLTTDALILECRQLLTRSAQ